MKKYLLILIIILAAVLRFWRLDSYPALNADEAAIGYNAYSLLQTGKDEHGNFWPVHFQSFNDYKPGLYFYLVLPFVKVLGLNEWAVRLPGAILGVATVLILYFLVKELFPSQQEFLIGEIAVFMLAISPWHIHFSRGAWEVNVATLFITAGVFFFLKGLKNQKYIILSSLFFILSLYTYHAARIIVPLLGFGLVIIYRKMLFKGIKRLILGLFFIVLLLIPLARDLSGPAGISRASGVGLLADQGPLNRVNEQRGEHSNYQNTFARIIHNKPINYSLAFLENWLGHFDGHFLFVSGDEIQRNKIPEMGVLYFFDIPFLFVGFVMIMKRRRDFAPILLWLIVAPTAAALTFQSPHALRAENMVIPLVIISAYGLYNIVGWLNGCYIANKKLRTACYILLATVVAWNFAFYQHMYWIHMSKEYSFSSQYGLKELVSYVKENESKYKQIVVTDRYDQPYILFLFYLKYPPSSFQKEHALTPRDKFGFSTVRSFNKYIFTSITSWDETRNQYKGALIAGTDGEIPGGNIIKKIYFPNGKIAFKIVAN